MTDRNANRKGYKKTPVGWIPEEWECVRAQDVYDIQLGKMLSADARQGTNPQPYLANFNVRWASFDLTHVQTMDFTQDEIRKFELRRGDLLVCEGGEPGRAAIWNEVIKPCYYQKALHRLRPKRPLIESSFMQAFLTRIAGSFLILNLTSQTSIAHLTQEKLQLLPIPLPPLPEQKKIAEILSTWDEAIEQTRALVAAAKLRKKALMQQLLTGKKRLGEYGKNSSTARRKTPLGLLPTDWELVTMGDIFQKVSRRNDRGVTRVLTASGQEGLIAQETFFNKTIAAEDTSGYYVLKRGEFAYNRSAMTEYPYGAIKRLDRYDDGVLSTLYACFSFKHPLCISDFYVQFFELRILDKQLRCITHVGGRAHGLLNITDANFYEMRIPLPALGEQRAIAAVLTTADEEIKSLEAKCAALERQKKGLMQKLLTGEVRVEV